MSLREQMDAIYGDPDPDAVPWDRPGPPAILVERVESGWVSPCDVVDLGCGTGAAAVWLADRGFRVTGIDLSSKAIERARERARDAGVDCRFEVLDVLADVTAHENGFDFAFEWEVLHHVFPEDRRKYVANVRRMLRPGGRYLSVCFSEDEPESFAGVGKFRTTRIGTTLYFSSEEEIRELFEPGFLLEDLRTVEVPGKLHPHVAILAAMVRRAD